VREVCHTLQGHSPGGGVVLQCVAVCCSVLLQDILQEEEVCVACVLHVCCMCVACVLHSPGGGVECTPPRDTISHTVTHTISHTATQFPLSLTHTRTHSHAQTHTHAHTHNLSYSHTIPLHSECDNVCVSDTVSMTMCV